MYARKRSISMSPGEHDRPEQSGHCGEHHGQLAWGAVLQRLHKPERLPSVRGRNPERFLICEHLPGCGRAFRPDGRRRWWGAGAAPGATVCSISYNNIKNVPVVQTHDCNAWARANKLCWAPDDETAPTCFSVCPPAVNVPQENAPMSLGYAPAWTGGDPANEN